MSEIIIADNNAWVQYTATAGQTLFDYDFPIFDQDHLVVEKTNVDGVTVTTLVRGTDYTVAGVGVEAGGTITLTTGATLNEIFTLYRDVPIARSTDFSTAGDFTAAAVNIEFDKIIQMMQQNERDILRTMRLQKSDTSDINGILLPLKSERSSKYMGFDVNGDIVATEGTNSAAPASMIPYTPPFTGAVATSVAAKLGESVSVKDFGILGDGSDVTAEFQAMLLLLSDGVTLRIPKGVYILSSGIVFTQNFATIICETDTEFKQADGTQTVDTLVEVSGGRVAWYGGNFSANLAGNPTYTGRGESLKWSGEYGTARDLFFNESHAGAGGVSSAFFVTGEKGVFDNIYVFDAGTTCVRDHGDYNTYKNLRFNEFGRKGFLKDYATGGAASNYTYVHVAYAYTAATGDREVVLFDHDTVQGDTAIIECGYFDTPNLDGSVQASPDQFKVAYIKDVTIRGYRGRQGVDTTYRTTLRVQQQVEKLKILDCVFPGSINFDPDVEANVYIGDGSVIGDTMEVFSAIEDFAGALTIADGCTLKNLQVSAVTISSSYPNTKINLGRVNYHGAATFTPVVVKNNAAVGARKMIAGNIKIDEPLSITGTMKSRQVDGSWITTGGFSQDVACAQSGPARVFLAAGSDYPPRAVEGVQRGDVFRPLFPTAGLSPAEYVCITAGAASTTAWNTATAYSLNAWVNNGGNAYVCSSAITSSDTAPTGTGTGIVDGDGTWDYVDTLAVFKGVGTISA